MTRITAAVLAVALVASSCASGPAPQADEGEPETARAQVPDLAGTWSGKLAAGGVTLRIVFRIDRDASGGYTALLDSPDQNARDIPVSSVTVTGAAVRLEVAVASAFFEGTLDAAANVLEGTWNQGGARFPLALSRGEPPAALRRPQVPKGPSPCLARDVTLRNEADGVTLAGTLTVPAGAGPFPAVVLISGSGQQNRDEEIFGHRPFLVLADALTRAGVAVLRYDDRGIGGSTGNPVGATTADFARDALAVFRYLRGVEGVDPRRVGLIGHSEGGMIACMLAASVPDVAFVVLLAGSALPGDEILLLQSAAILRASGQGEEALAADRELRVKLHAAAKADTELDQARAELGALLRGAGVPEGQVAAAAEQYLSPWMRFFLRYDPRRDLERIGQPVLALIGSKDLQVPPAENLAATREALARAGNRRVTLMELEGLNHLFQTATTGLPAEYGTIEETMAPVVLDTVARWILGL